jgi:hypothetical protein
MPQLGDAEQLRRDAASQKQWHRLNWREPMKQHRPRNGREREPSQPGGERTGKNGKQSYDKRDVVAQERQKVLACCHDSLYRRRFESGEPAEWL